MDRPPIHDGGVAFSEQILDVGASGIFDRNIRMQPLSMSAMRSFCLAWSMHTVIWSYRERPAPPRVRLWIG